MMRIPTAVAVAIVGALAVLVPKLASGASPNSTAQPTKAVTTYTCCAQRDVDTVRHPGETFQIHWIPVVRHEPVDRPPVTVVLEASLSGGYSSVRRLKESEVESPSVLVRARPLTITGSASTPPVSTITIPRTASPGYYDLTTTHEFGGGSTSGSSIIRVAPN